MFVATPVHFRDDPVMELHHEASARRAGGRRCIDATLGVLVDDAGALVVLPAVAEAMRDTGPTDWAPYASSHGTDAFLEAVTADCLGPWPRLRERAVAIATPGATGAIRSAFTAFLARGEACLTSSPHWGVYAAIASASERRLSTFELFEPNRQRFDVADFERQLARTVAEQRRALVLLNDPCHNPTGYTMRARDWAQVAVVLDRYAAAAPIGIVLDSVYSAFCPDGSSGALRALEPLRDKLLLAVAWSASKSLTCYGLRVGALLAVAPDAAERKNVRNALAGHACGTWGNCNGGGLVAVTRLLTDPRLRRSVQSERRAHVDRLNARNALFHAAAVERGLVCPPCGGGFFTAVFVDDPRRVAATLRERGVYVVPMRASVRVALSAVPTGDVIALADELRAAVESSPASDRLAARALP
jgi:aromatic-amino-acid transaminase